MPFEVPQVKTGASILPGVFVTLLRNSNTLDTVNANDFTVWQAGAGSAAHGDYCLGIATMAQRNAPLPSSNGNAAIAANDEIRIAVIGEIGLVYCNNNAVRCGWPLKSGANGWAECANNNNDIISALALEGPSNNANGANGEYIRALVVSPYQMGNNAVFQLA